MEVQESRRGTTEEGMEQKERKRGRESRRKTREEERKDSRKQRQVCSLSLNSTDQ